MQACMSISVRVPQKHRLLDDLLCLGCVADVLMVHKLCPGQHDGGHCKDKL